MKTRLARDVTDNPPEEKRRSYIPSDNRIYENIHDRVKEDADPIQAYLQTNIKPKRSHKTATQIGYFAGSDYAKISGSLIQICM